MEGNVCIDAIQSFFKTLGRYEGEREKREMNLLCIERKMLTVPEISMFGILAPPSG